MRLAALSAAGVALFAWPFFGLGLPASAPALAVAAGSVLVLVAVEAGTRRLDSRRLALLAALAALDGALRLAVVIGIGGFSPFFLLVLCAGYVFGPSYGFLAGALSLLVSALVTGGVGPWVPYQTFAAGWVGAVAGLAGRRTPGAPGWRDVAVLAVMGVVTGYAFGAVMDVWDWTFFRGTPGVGWAPGMPPGEAAGRFARFYVTTSAVYDSFRAAGNAILALALGRPLLAAMTRFRNRFALEVVPGEDPPSWEGADTARS